MFCSFQASPLRVLSCHDMAGAYHEEAAAQGVLATNADRDGDNVQSMMSINGTADSSSCSSSSLFCGYNFYHWELIDISVYFSHARITIPPAGKQKDKHQSGTSQTNRKRTDRQHKMKRAFSPSSFPSLPCLPPLLCRLD